MCLFVPPELPQQYVCKEEDVPADQQLCVQERDFSLDQGDPEPLQIKEEKQEIFTSQEGEQLLLKQETDTFMLTPDNEDSNQSKPEPDSDHQLLSHNSSVAENQDFQDGREHVDSGSTTNAEPKTLKTDENTTEEISGVFEKTIIEYKEEVDLQHRQLDIVRKAERKLHRTGL